MDANIPGYAVIKQIGQGGMASVYLAYQQNLERRVALKVLHPALAENPEFCARFLREAKIGASLCHRNIVPIYEIGRFKHFHYLAMEYLPNGDLRRRLAVGCDTRAVLRIIYDIAAALGYAHVKSYIHRDIKPENIMFREDQTAVLTDFGIALDVGATHGVATPQEIAGSPQYMSPEHANAGRLDYRSDIYSLGAVLYEALAGHPLLEPSATLADAVRHSTVPAPCLPAEVAWLQPVLDRMLARNPDQRFEDMGELMGALEPYLEAPNARADGAQAGGARRARPVAGEAIRHEQAPEPSKSQRHPPESFGGYRRTADNLIDREPDLVLPPSAPTLVVNASDDLAAALASCPQPVSPLFTPVEKPRPRSRVGILLVVLGLAAVPLALSQWPTLQEDLSARLALVNPAELPPADALSGVFERESSALTPSSDVDAVPDAAPDAGQTAFVDVAPAALSPGGMAGAAPEPVGAPIPATPESAQPPSTLADTVVDTAAPVQAAEDDLLQQADAALQAAPASQENLDAASARFREVLARSPTNPDAREGLANVASRYLELASIALNQDQLKSAQEYVDLASNITNRYGLGGNLREKIVNFQYVLNRLYQLEFQPAPQPYRDAQVNWNQ